MVSLTINLDDSVMQRLRNQAAERGVSVDKLLAAGVQLLLDTADANVELTDAEVAKIEAADAEIDRGEFVSHDEVMRQLKALRG